MDEQARQQAIERLLERYERSDYRGRLPAPPARHAAGHVPRCGDTLTVYALVEGDRVVRVAFEGAGCTVSQAGADAAAELATAQPLAEVRSLSPEAPLDLLGREVVLTRLDCATLGMRTLLQALSPGGVVAPPERSRL